MSSNGKTYPILFALISIVASYGGGGYNNVPDYPQQSPAIPVFVPYPAPAPPVLPELPASHEFLRPRRHRHHHSRSSSDSRSRSRSNSRSNSREHGKHCKHCKKIRKSCNGEAKCFTPDIYYFHYKGCYRAVITCDSQLPYRLETSDGEVLTAGLGTEKVAKCGKHEKWSADDVDGNKVNFKTLRCILPNV